MSEKFTASEALREIILQEEGLWKDPETGKLVYRMPMFDDVDGRSVRVVGMRGAEWEKDTTNKAALNYFKAHPAEKPWHDAKEGEIWGVKMKLPETKPEPRAVMRRDDGTGSFVDPQARKPSIPLDSPFIREARRIWPEEEK